MSLTSPRFSTVATGPGGEVYIDGHKIKGVRNWEIRANVGEPMTMTIELWVNMGEAPVAAVEAVVAQPPAPIDLDEATGIWREYLEAEGAA